MRKKISRTLIICISLALAMAFSPAFSTKANAATIGVPTDITIQVGEYNSVTYYFTGSNCQNIEFRYLFDSDADKVQFHSRCIGSGSNYAYYSVEYFGMKEGKAYFQPYDTATNTAWNIYTVDAQAPVIDIDSCNGREMQFSFDVFCKNGVDPEPISIGYYGTDSTVYHGNGLSYTTTAQGGWSDQNDPFNQSKIIWKYTYNCKLTLYTNGSYSAMIYRSSDMGVRCKLNFNIHNHIGGEAVEENRVEPTCVNSGSCDSVVYCSNCGIEMSRSKVTLDPTGIHDWEDETTIDVEPTCTEEGVKSHHCKNCDATNDPSPVEPLGHNLITQTTNPTCVKSGVTKEVCTRCSYSNVIATVEASGHNWENGYTIDVEPTCTETGQKSIHCKVCDAIQEGSAVSVDAKGHVYGAWETTTEPTCTETGSESRECTVCGNKEERVIPETGHSWMGKYTVDREPTCTEAGEESIYCKKCDAKDPESTVVIEPIGHSYFERVVEPTCTQTGNTLHICGRCGDSYTDSETEAKGHSFGEWITDTDSTCTSDGIMHRECSECGYTETKGINKKEHSFSTEFEVDKEATCTSDGSKSHHCTAEGCNATEGSVVIPATGHSYGEWTITEESTCTEKGAMQRECSVCNEIESVELFPAGHVWMKAYTTDKMATCKEEGSESIHCAVCDIQKEGTSQTIPKKEHSWNSGLETKPATYDEEGIKTFECTSCGETREETIPKLPKESIEGAKISGLKAVTYTGKEIKQTPNVVLGKVILEEGTDYDVTYSNNKKVGTATVTITGKNAYEGTATATFRINPKPTTVSTVTPLSKGFKAKWKKGSGITGYELQYALNSKFTKSKKTVKITRAGTLSKKITKLTAKKKYYVRIRTYKMVNGKKYNSSWSKYKTVTTK